MGAKDFFMQWKPYRDPQVDLIRGTFTSFCELAIYSVYIQMNTKRLSTDLPLYSLHMKHISVCSYQPSSSFQTDHQPLGKVQVVRGPL